MVDWTSQVELSRETGMLSYRLLYRPRSHSTLLAVAYANVVFASFGLYIWEVFQTSDFEWSVIEGKRKLKLELVSGGGFRLHSRRSPQNIPCVQSTYTFVPDMCHMVE